MSEQAQTRGVHHVGLSVADVGATRDFFVQRLGFAQVGAQPDYPALFVSDGSVMLTLWQLQDAERARAFDRKHNVGLHHLALRVPDVAALERLHARLANSPEAVVEFAPEPLGETDLQHMMCTVPGGLRLELVAGPG